MLLVRLKWSFFQLWRIKRELIFWQKKGNKTNGGRSVKMIKGSLNEMKKFLLLGWRDKFVRFESSATRTIWARRSAGGWDQGSHILLHLSADKMWEPWNRHRRLFPCLQMSVLGCWFGFLHQQTDSPSCYPLSVGHEGSALKLIVHGSQSPSCFHLTISILLYALAGGQKNIATVWKHTNTPGSVKCLEVFLGN